jgi:ATP-dependent helicase/nuclease subunit B
MLSLPTVYTILPGIPFAKALATQLWQEYRDDLGALSDVQIYLPNRRSVRALADMFLEVSDGQATLLPRMTPLGDIDEEDLLEDDPFILEEDPFLTPAIPALERQILLTRLIMARDDIRLNAAEAFRLAGDLARFLDRSHTEQVSLDQLADLVTGDLAIHWQKTKDFLTIITQAWPNILHERNQSDPAERRNIVFEKKIAALLKNPPQHRVIAAGSTGSIPSTAALLSAIAGLPNGCVVLPGLDPSIDDTVWDAIDPMHPYFYQKHLVERMAIDRRSIQLWPGQDCTPNQQEKLKLAHYALQPQDVFDLSDAVIDKKILQGLEFIVAENPLHEAKIIALHLREVLNVKDQTAMVVTPDRVLAQYIQQEMQRWNVAVNDSAGVSLGDTSIGLFLKLIAGFAQSSTPKTHILSILRHEYFRLHAPQETRAKAIDELETKLREKFLPHDGLSGFAVTYETGLLKDTLDILQPFTVAGQKTLQEWLALHITAAEHMATTATVPGTDVLWKYEDGESAAQLLYKLHEASASNPIEMTIQDYASFIGSALDQVVVRPRYGIHPRLRILSPIEARLQHADLVIMAGLNEGVWPAPVKADTWLSRPMQSEMKFGSPDRRIGQSALDFQLFICSPHVLATWSKKREGVLAHPSRWLQQIFAVLDKNKMLPKFNESPYYQWAQHWDSPVKLTPHPAPSYAPPLKLRPRQLPVTAIETLQKDPYAIYARRILKLYPAELLDRYPDARDWGNAAHKILENFFRGNGFHHQDPAAYFDQLGADVLKEYPLNRSQEKSWNGKLVAIRDWLLANEQNHDAVIHPESKLSMRFTLPDASHFELTGRVDRLDVTADQIVITDYKTGSVPTETRVKNGQAPQLPLLGLLAQHSTGLQNKEISLRYIKLNGKIANPADIKQFKDTPTLIQTSQEVLNQLLVHYYIDNAPYEAKAMHSSDHDNYQHLKRVAEWATLDEGSDETGDDA